MSDAWDAFLAGLRGIGPVEEVAPGRTVVDHDGHAVTVVMTPRDWDELVTTTYGAVAPAVAAVEQQVRTLDTAYLVYDTYELHGSATPQLPPEDFPSGTAGQWYAHPPDHA